MSKTMIVTGASRGIGAAIAKEAAGKGINLLLNARSEDALKAIAETLGGDATRLAIVAGDISDEKVCERVVATAVEHFSGIDVVVNNAGVLDPIGPLDAVAGSEWVRNLLVNVIGPVLLSQRAIRFLSERSGCIINISSGAAVKAIRGWSAYCTSKAALNHFTRMLAAEYPQITSVAVSPGMTATDMQVMIRERGERRMPHDEYRRFVEAHQRGELRSPQSVARAIVALGLGAPRAMSGEFVTVDDPRITSLL